MATEFVSFNNYQVEFLKGDGEFRFKLYKATLEGGPRYDVSLSEAVIVESNSNYLKVRIGKFLYEFRFFEEVKGYSKVKFKTSFLGVLPTSGGRGKVSYKGKAIFFKMFREGCKC